MFPREVVHFKLPSGPEPELLRFRVRKALLAKTSDTEHLSPAQIDHPAPELIS